MVPTQWQLKVVYSASVSATGTTNSLFPMAVLVIICLQIAWHVDGIHYTTIWQHIKIMYWRLRHLPQKSPTLQYPLHHQNISLTLKSSSCRNSCISSRLISTSRSQPCTSDGWCLCKKCQVYLAALWPWHEQINAHNHLNPKKQNSLEKQKKRKKIYGYDCHHLPFTNHTKDITVKIMDLAPNLVSNHEKESAGANGTGHSDSTSL